MTTTTPVRTWTTIGEELYDETLAGQEGHNSTTRDRLEQAIDSLTWDDMTDATMTVPASQGMAINAAIESLGLPRVTAVAIGTVECVTPAGHLDTLEYGLYGIRCQYRGGAAQVYVVDRGSDLICVASEYPMPA